VTIPSESSGVTNAGALSDSPRQRTRPVAAEPNRQRVVVLVDTATGWGRGLVRGISRHARLHGWHLWVEPHGQSEALRPPRNWTGEGIIARVSSAAMTEQLRRFRVPIVNVSGIELEGISLPRVTINHRATGTMAAEYFVDRGFRHFAYCGWVRSTHVHRQFEAFAAGTKGRPCELFALGSRNSSSHGWKQQQSQLSKWLTQLPKPVAVFTWAQQGLAVLNACAWARLQVPEEVAVLTGDDDDLLYEITTPPLSGIHIPLEQLGMEAATVLGKLMDGGKAPAEPVLINPTHVVTRQSSDVLGVEDADLATAVRFIRQHAPEPIQVDDVAREVGIARRSLERKFHDGLGRSPAAEIRRVRLARATQLLAETSMPIPKVAQASGFGSQMYLASVVREATGLTPLKYRNKTRAM
jgi:LacI family transcriptional regulator